MAKLQFVDPKGPQVSHKSVPTFRWRTLLHPFIFVSNFHKSKRTPPYLVLRSSNSQPKEFRSEFHLTGGLKTEEEKQAYRNAWTKEDESNKIRRFRTTMNGSGLSKPGGLDRTAGASTGAPF